jgi:hypothetical protein
MKIEPKKTLRGSKKLEDNEMEGVQRALDPLSQVLSFPDQDEPRINFASKLDATDPRRDFIRHQLVIAHLDRDRDKDNPKRLEAVLASSQLSENHYRDWRPGWRDDVAERVQEYRFHRGFVELVKISGEDFLEVGSELLKAAPIRHLDLMSTAGFWQQLSRDQELRTIRSISIFNDDLTDEDVYWLAQSSFLMELRWLSLSNNDIREAGVTSIAAAHGTTLPLLKYVSFAGNYCNPVERFSSDGDLIADTWLPEFGKKLEQAYGRISWLHIQAQSLKNLPPDRFALPEESIFFTGLDRHSRVSGSPIGILAEAL